MYRKGRSYSWKNQQVRRTRVKNEAENNIVKFPIGMNDT